MHMKFFIFFLKQGTHKIFDMHDHDRESVSLVADGQLHLALDTASLGLRGRWIWVKKQGIP